MMRMPPTTLRFLFVLPLFAASSAVAQTPPPVAAQNTERVVETAPSTDTQNWTASAGAILNSGNTHSFAMSGGTNFQITRGSHQFAFEANGNYGRSRAAGAPIYSTNAKNIVSRLRYDYFFSRQHAAFVSAVHRYDPLSGLDTRIQGQIGYQYNFVREDKHRIWTELGYDITFDNLVQSGVPPIPPDDTRVYHSARGYLGWLNNLNDTVHFKTGLEGLFNVEHSTDWRLNWENTLTTQVNGRLSIEIKFNLLYDHQPVPGFQNTDTRTTLNLVLDMW